MNATALKPAPRTRTHAVTGFAVDVVDGNGLDVAGEPVTAVFRRADGSEAVVRQATDAGGRTSFADEREVVEVVVIAGREVLGPLRPALEAHLVIEM